MVHDFDALPTGPFKDHERQGLRAILRDYGFSVRVLKIARTWSVYLSTLSGLAWAAWKFLLSALV